MIHLAGIKFRGCKILNSCSPSPQHYSSADPSLANIYLAWHFMTGQNNKIFLQAQQVNCDTCGLFANIMNKT